MTKGERIKKLRKCLDISQTELANAIGISKQTLYKYENNIVTNIPSDKIELIASELNTTPAYIMGWKEDEDSTAGVEIPVIGRVAAGYPIEAVEEILGMEEIDRVTANTGEFFALRLRGDSMEPRMCNGDVVIVRKQETADDGDFVIASVNGTDATCKRLKIYSDGIALVSLNSKYDPMFFSAREIEELPVTIWGKVVELREKF